MNTLPSQYIDDKVFPLSLMAVGFEYLLSHDSLLLDTLGRFWVRRNQHLGREIESWEDENAMVYIARVPQIGGDPILAIRIPLTFSKRKKWVRDDWVDPNEYIMIDEIVIG